MDRQAQFPFSPAQLFRSLTVLITPMGIQGSGGELFKGAIFGRDSLRVALDLLPWFPSVAETVMFSLAHYQSTGRDAVADATGPGQIPHEVRSRFVGPRMVGPRQQELLTLLARQWGGSETDLIYYGSVDATPQFIRMIAAYTRRYGTTILDDTLRHLDGSERTLRDSVIAAVTWLEDEITRNDQPLLGFQRLNTEHGHRWQILQDGGTSLLHTSGHLANAEAPIETIGLQGLAYDALLDAAALLGEAMPTEAARWQELAARLQAATFAQFWMPNDGYFAMGIDRDPATGERRQIATISAMATELLETRIFDTLPDEQRDRYIGGIVRTAHGPELLTPAGIRTRGLRHLDLLPYPDYHGVMTCWGVTNSMYAYGLASQGLHALSDDIVHRSIGMLGATGGLYEFLYADRNGVVRDPLTIVSGQDTSGIPADDLIIGTNKPETDQGWTLSYALREFMEAGDPEPAPEADGSWHAALTAEIDARAPFRRDFTTRPGDRKPAYLDKAAAVEIERAYLAAEYPAT
jgi:glycogen debranching enzyme